MRPTIAQGFPCYQPPLWGLDSGQDYDPWSASPRPDGTFTTRAGGPHPIRVTVGRVGVITPEEARRRAARIISRIKAGEEPLPEPEVVMLAKGPTVGELVETYLKEVVEVRLKPRSAKTYRSSIDNHILPAFGRKSALSIDHAAVSAFHHSLRETPAAANQAVEVLFRIYRAAEERETIPEGSNPCRQIAMNRPRRHERFLTDEEFQRLGWALDEAEETGGARMYAAMAIRLLLLTGCRKNEIVDLHWDHVDLKAGEMAAPRQQDRGAHGLALVRRARDPRWRAPQVGLDLPLAANRQLPAHGGCQQHLESPEGRSRPVRCSPSRSSSQLRQHGAGGGRDDPDHRSSSWTRRSRDDAEIHPSVQFHGARSG